MRKIFLVILFLFVFIGFSGCWNDSSKKNETADNEIEDFGIAKEDEMTGGESGKAKSNRVFKSKLVDLSFIMPEGTEYVEENAFLDEKERMDYEGKSIIIYDNAKNRERVSAFVLVTKDYNYKKKDAEGFDSHEAYDTIELSSDAKEPVHHVLNHSDSERVIRRGEDTYQIIGFSDYECDSNVASYLVFVFPEESELKYATFYLGSLSDFKKFDYEESCKPKDSAIEERIELIQSGGVEEINKNLDRAMEIVKNFEY